MKRITLQFPRLMTLLVPMAAAGLMGCDKNSVQGFTQSPANYNAVLGTANSLKAYHRMFEASANRLGDSTYLVITKAKRGTVFSVRSGALPAPTRAVCFSSANTSGFQECVERYCQDAGAVAVQSDAAGWWATPL